MTDRRSHHSETRDLWRKPALSRIGTFGSVMQGGSMNKGEGGIMMMSQGK